MADKELENKTARLKLDRENVQKKTFTKWCNVQIKKASSLYGDSVKASEIDDLEIDLRDGVKLLTILGVLSEERTMPLPEKIPRPGAELMRIYKIINVDKALKWLQLRLPEQLSNISAEDIVDGNLKLTMGLIWVLILRFPQQRFRIGAVDVDPIASETPEPDSNSTTTQSKPRRNIGNSSNVKGTLLNWCQRVLSPYSHAGIIPVVTDFSQSWQSGAVFLCLVHAYDNDLIPEISPCVSQFQPDGTYSTPEKSPDSLPSKYRSKNVDDWLINLQTSFDLAEKKIDIPALLDPEDIAHVDTPDERIVMTYISEFYWIMKDRPLPPHPDELALQNKRKEAEELDNQRRIADVKFRDHFSFASALHLKEVSRLSSWVNKQQQGFMKLAWVLTSATSLELAQDKLIPLANEDVTFIFSGVIKGLISDEFSGVRDMKKFIMDELTHSTNSVQNAIAILKTSNDQIVKEDDLDTDLELLCARIHRLRLDVHGSARELQSMKSNFNLQLDVDTTIVDDTHQSAATQLSSFLTDSFASVVDQVKTFATWSEEWDATIDKVSIEIFGLKVQKAAEIENVSNFGGIYVKSFDVLNDLNMLKSKVSDLAEIDTQSSKDKGKVAIRKLKQRNKVIRNVLAPIVPLLSGSSTTVHNVANDNFLDGWEDESGNLKLIDELNFEVEQHHMPRASNLKSRLMELIEFLESEQMVHRPVPEFTSSEDKNPPSSPTRPLSPSTFSDMLTQRSTSIRFVPAAQSASRFTFLPRAILIRAQSMADSARKTVVEPATNATFSMIEDIQKLCNSTKAMGMQWRHTEKQTEIESLKEISISMRLYGQKVEEAVKFVHHFEDEFSKIRLQDPSIDDTMLTQWLHNNQQWCGRARSSIAAFLGEHYTGEVFITKEALHSSWKEAVTVVQKDLGDLANIAAPVLTLKQSADSGNRFDLTLDFGKSAVFSQIPHYSILTRAQAFRESLITFETGPLARAFESRREGIVAGWMCRADAVEDELERVALIGGVTEEEIFSETPVPLRDEDSEIDLEFIEEACRAFGQEVVSKWWGSAKEEVLGKGDDENQAVEGDDDLCLKTLKATLTRETDFRTIVQDTAANTIDDTNNEAMRLSNDVMGGFIVDIWGEFLKDTEAVVTEFAESGDEITANEILERISMRAMELKSRVKNVNHAIANVSRRMSREAEAIQMVSDRILSKVIEPTILWLMRSQGVVEDIDLSFPEVKFGVESMSAGLDRVLKESGGEIAEEKLENDSTAIKAYLTQLQQEVEDLEAKVKISLRKRVQNLKAELPNRQKVLTTGEEIFDGDDENPPLSAVDPPETPGGNNEFWDRISRRISIKAENSDEDPVLGNLLLGGFLKARLAIFVKNLQLIGRRYGTVAKLLQDKVRSVLDWSRAIVEFDGESKKLIVELRKKKRQIQQELEKLPTGLGKHEIMEVDATMDDYYFDMFASIEREIRSIEEAAMSEGWSTYKYYRVQEVATGLITLLHSTVNDGGVVRAAVDPDIVRKVQQFIAERGMLIDQEVAELENGEKIGIYWALGEVDKSRTVWEKIGRPGNELLEDIKAIEQDIKVLDDRLQTSISENSGTIATTKAADIAFIARELRIGRVKIILSRAFASKAKLISKKSSTASLSQMMTNSTRRASVYSLNTPPQAGEKLGLVDSMRECIYSLGYETQAEFIDYVDGIELAVIDISEKVEKFEISAVERALDGWRRLLAEPCERKINELEIQISSSNDLDGSKVSPQEFLEGLIKKYENINAEAETLWKSIVKFESSTDLIVKIILDTPVEPSTAGFTVPQNKHGSTATTLVNESLKDEEEARNGFSKAEPLRKRYNDVNRRYMSLHEIVETGLAISQEGLAFLRAIQFKKVELESIEKDIDAIGSSAAKVVDVKDANLSSDSEFESLETRMEAIEQDLMMNLGATLDRLLSGDQDEESEEDEQSKSQPNIGLIPAVDREGVSEILPNEFQILVDYVSRVRDSLVNTRQSRSVLELYKKQAGEVRVWVESRVSALRAIEKEVASEVDKLLEAISAEVDEKDQRKSVSTNRDSRSSIAESITQTIRDESSRVSLSSVVSETLMRTAERTNALKNVENTLDPYLKGNEKLRAFAVTVVQTYKDLATSSSDENVIASSNSISAAITKEQEEIDAYWKELTESITRIRTRLEFRISILNWVHLAMDKTASVFDVLDKLEGGEGWSAVLLSATGDSAATPEPSTESKHASGDATIGKRALLLEKFSRVAGEVISGWEDEVLVLEEEAENLETEAREIRQLGAIQAEEQPLLDAYVEQNLVVLSENLKELQSSLAGKKDILWTLGHKTDTFVLRFNACKEGLNETIQQLRQRLFSDKKTPELDKLPSEQDNFILTGNDFEDKRSLMAWVRTQVASSMNIQSSLAQKVQEISNLGVEIQMNCQAAFEGGMGAGGSVMISLKEQAEEYEKQVRDKWKEASRLAASEKDAVDRATKYHQWNSMINRLTVEVTETCAILIEPEAVELGEEDIQQIKSRMTTIEEAVEKLCQSVEDSQRSSIIGGLMAASAESRNSSLFRSRADNLSKKLLEVTHRLKELESFALERKWKRTVDEKIDRISNWCTDQLKTLNSRISILPPRELNADIKTKENIQLSTTVNLLKSIIRSNSALDFEYTQHRNAINALSKELLGPENSHMSVPPTYYVVEKLLEEVGELLGGEKLRIERTEKLKDLHRSAIDIVTWINATQVQVKDLLQKVEGHYANLIQAPAYSNTDRSQKMYKPETEVKDMEDKITLFKATIEEFVENGSSEKSKLSEMVEDSQYTDFGEFIEATDRKTKYILKLWEDLLQQMDKVKGSSSSQTRQIEFQKQIKEISKIIGEINERFESARRVSEFMGRDTPFGRATPGLLGRATPALSRMDVERKDPDALYRELQVELEGIVLPRIEDLKKFFVRTGVSPPEKKTYSDSYNEILQQAKDLSQVIRSARKQLALEAKKREFNLLLEEADRIQSEFAKAIQLALKSADSAGIAWGIADAEAAALMLDGRFDFYNIEVRSVLLKSEKLAKQMNEVARQREAAAKWNGVKSWKDGVKEELLERAKKRRAFIATTPGSASSVVSTPLKRKNTKLPRVASGRKPGSLNFSSLSQSDSLNSTYSTDSPKSAQSQHQAITMLNTPVRIYVPPRKLYQPNPHDELDIEIAKIVNACPLSIRVTAVDNAATTSGGFGSRPLSAPKYMKNRGYKAGAKYTFGEALPKSCYCRLLPNNSVVVRVGGGWQELSKFLLEHSTLEHRIPTVRSFVDYDPYYDPADPAGTSPSPMPGHYTVSKTGTIGKSSLRLSTSIPSAISSQSDDEVSPLSSPTSSKTSPQLHSPRPSSGSGTSSGGSSFIPVPKRTLKPQAAIIKLDREEISGGAVNPYALTPRVAALIMNSSKGSGLRKPSAIPTPVRTSSSSSQSSQSSQK